MDAFMPGTGREFGLEVNNNIDERYHMEKETKAACKYLNEAYAKYNNWLCVAAAYKAGQGTYLHTVTKANGESGGRPLAGRRNLTLYVPLAGSKSCYQQPATIRFFDET